MLCVAVHINLYNLLAAMSSTDTKLSLLLVKYIDKYEGIEELREVLKKTSASSRYEVLISCKGANSWTPILRSAIKGDVKTLKCMLVGLNSQQIYKVMKFNSDGGCAPLNEAVAQGYTDIIMYILCNLSLEDRFNTLKLRNRYGQTPAHSAAYRDKPEALQLLLTSVAPEQQRELLALKANNGSTVENFIAPPDLSCDYFSAKELGTANRRVNELESLLKAQGKIISQQVTELSTAKQKVQKQESLLQEQRDTISQQATELCKAKQRIQQLESRHTVEETAIAHQAAALQRLTERQEEMQRETQRALREMNEFNRRCFSTGDTGDQEHEF